MFAFRVTVTLLCLGLPAWADNVPKGKQKERAEQQRQALQKLEADPGRRARLLQDLRAFQELPREQQNRLRKIDKDLHEANPATAARLNRSLVRYVEWLENLPEAKRNYIEKAPDSKERLLRIRQLREQEWIETLPLAQRNQIQSATGEARAALVKKFKLEEKQRRQDWQAAIRHWDELQKGSPPTQRSELPTEMQLFIEKTLLPRVTTADAERLKAAEGKWPLFMETVVELSERYVPFPGAARPKEPVDLPEEMRKRINGLPPGRRGPIQAAEGKWPEYPLAIISGLRRPKGVLIPRLTPVKAADFDESLQNFIRTQLIPRLSADENRFLSNAEGSWPDYPRAVVNLAGKHNLIVPGMLPIPKTHAEKYRTKAEKQ